MPSKAEIILSFALREALSGVELGQALPDSHALDEAVYALEWVLPEVLAEGGAIRWRFEGIDGFLLAQVVKTAPREARLLGLAVTLAKFEWTPFHASIRLAKDEDAIEWIRCGLGETLDDGRMHWVPEDKCSKVLFRLPDRFDDIEWTYEAERGPSTEVDGGSSGRRNSWERRARRREP